MIVDQSDSPCIEMFDKPGRPGALFQHDVHVCFLSHVMLNTTNSFLVRLRQLDRLLPAEVTRESWEVMGSRESWGSP